MDTLNLKYVVYTYTPWHEQFCCSGEGQSLNGVKSREKGGRGIGAAMMDITLGLWKKERKNERKKERKKGRREGRKERKREMEGGREGRRSKGDRKKERETKKEKNKERKEMGNNLKGE